MTDATIERMFRVTFDESAPDAHWSHYRVGIEDAEALAAAEGLRESVAEALVIDAARPRATTFPDGLLVVLRGANLNTGADPHDLVAVRMWCTPTTLLTVTVRRVRSVSDVHARFGTDEQPENAVDAMVAITERIVDRMGELVDELSDRVDGLQETLADPDAADVQSHQATLTQLRLAASSLRRHTRPQREAMLRLYREPAPFVADAMAARMREATDRMIRYVEDLDEIRERAVVLQDGIEHASAAQMNRNMYVLSLIAGIFLPLGFITGLLGINVGGMPGTDTKSAFWIVVVLLAGLVWFEVWFMRRQKMW